MTTTDTTTPDEGCGACGGTGRRLEQGRGNGDYFYVACTSCPTTTTTREQTLTTTDDRRVEIKIKPATHAPRCYRLHWLMRWRWDVTAYRAAGDTTRFHIIGDSGYTRTKWGAGLAAIRAVHRLAVSPDRTPDPAQL